MRVWMSGVVLCVAGMAGCKHDAAPAQASVAQAGPAKGEAGEFVGFDRNLYPGDNRMAELKKHFDFVGFWLNNPPGETMNGWVGKRKILRDTGFGFVVLANGRLDKDILAFGKRAAKMTPAQLGNKDAADAVAAAQREGFPAKTILFLDQEEGGRLLPEQSGYFFGWTEAVAAAGYRPGAYLSGQRDADGTGLDGKSAFITTAQDVREHVAREHRHEVTLWVYDDTCPPAPGCVLAPPHIRDSGTMDAPVWQYAQSPRRPELTKSCAKTYGADGNCYGGASTDLFLDLNVASSADPSRGR